MIIIVIQEAVYRHEFFGPFKTVKDGIDYMQGCFSKVDQSYDHDADGHHEYLFYLCDPANPEIQKVIGKLCADKSRGVDENGGVCIRPYAWVAESQE